MMHVVGFRDGKAFYRNRFIRTDGLLAENEAGGPLWPGLAEPVQMAKRDHGWGARTLMKDASSTDVIVHRGTALTSFYQCGDLYRVDPSDGRDTGQGGLQRALPIRLGRVGASEGRRRHRRVAVLQLQQAGPVHALWRGRRQQRPGAPTPISRCLVRGCRTTWRSPRITPSSTTFRCSGIPSCWKHDIHLPGFHPDMPSRFAVIPRRGGPDDIRWFEADPTFVLHFTNAYEDGDEIVLDGFYEGDPHPVDSLTGDKWQKAFRFLALDRLQTRLHRWRFNLVTGADHRGAAVRQHHRIRHDQRRLRGPQLPLHLRRDRQTGLVPVRRTGQARPAHRFARSASRSTTASTAARRRWRRAPAAPARTTATWSP